jgi:hypothetical protein
MRLLDKDAILQEDFSEEFWEPVDYDSFRALISIYPEVDVKTIDIKTEVAEEIFAEIEGAIGDSVFYEYSKEFDECFRKNYNGQMLVKLLAELKNKYIGLSQKGGIRE